MNTIHHTYKDYIYHQNIHNCTSIFHFHKSYNFNIIFLEIDLMTLQQYCEVDESKWWQSIWSCSDGPSSMPVGCCGSE